MPLNTPRLMGNTQPLLQGTKTSTGETRASAARGAADLFVSLPLCAASPGGPQACIGRTYRAGVGLGAEDVWRSALPSVRAGKALRPEYER